MPGEVVEEVVWWLEWLLRGVVESVMRYKRRRRGVESTGVAGIAQCVRESRERRGRRVSGSENEG